jgi:hypothetical protein
MQCAVAGIRENVNEVSNTGFPQLNRNSERIPHGDST